jgi:hypothetical protein
MKEDAKKSAVETKDSDKSAVNGTTKGVVTPDTKRVAKKATKKKTATTARTKTKKTKKSAKTLKSMKAKTLVKADPKDIKAMRVLCNKVLTSPAGRKAGLSLVEHSRGAIQVKRADGLLFTFRNCGKGCVITHPVFEDKTKKKRWMKHAGEKWNHLTECRWDQVTLKMLMDRVNDSKSGKEYYNSFYKGKKKEKSGLFLKSEAAKARVAKLQKTTTKKKNEKTKTKKAAMTARTKTKKAKVKKPVTPVIQKVAESIS